MGIDPKTVAATISKLKANGQIGSEGGKVSVTAIQSSTEATAFPTKVNSIVGMEATYTIPENGYYFLHEPKIKRDVDYYIGFASSEEADDEWFATNGTSDGLLNKRVFSVGGKLTSICPTFEWNYPGYTNIMYLYEETSDNLGMGLTLPKGWYAINVSTFAATPFNIKDNPVIVSSFNELVVSSGDPDFEDFVKENWFELEKVRTFTITEKNIIKDDDRDAVFIADMTNKQVAEGDEGFGDVIKIIQLLAVFVAFKDASGNYESFASDGFRSITEQVTLTYSGGIKPIDPKYLPNPADLSASWIADLKTALGIA